MKRKISDDIYYIQATDIPLSSDVGIVEGKDFCWVFDVGNNEETLQALTEIKKDIMNSTPAKGRGYQ